MNSEEPKDALHPTEEKYPQQVAICYEKLVW